MVQLCLVVMLINVGMKLDLLDLLQVLLLLRFALTLALLVLVLAVVHHTTNRWIRLRGHLHQIQPRSLGSYQRVIEADDPQLLIVFGDQSYLSPSVVTITRSELPCDGWILLCSPAVVQRIRATQLPHYSATARFQSPGKPLVLRAGSCFDGKNQRPPVGRHENILAQWSCFFTVSGQFLS